MRQVDIDLEKAYKNHPFPITSLMVYTGNNTPYIAWDESIKDYRPISDELWNAIKAKDQANWDETWLKTLQEMCLESLKK